MQRNCPKPKKVTAEVLATDTGADAGEDSYRHENLSQQYIFSSRGGCCASGTATYIDTSASTHFIGDGQSLEHPVHRGAIMHASMGGTHAGSTGMFTLRAGGNISLQAV